MNFSAASTGLSPKGPGQPTGKPGEYFVLRNGSAPVLDLMDGALTLENRTCGGSSGGLEAVIITAEPGVSCWEGKSSDGDKCYYMMEGSLEVIVGDEPHLLTEGDSLSLNSKVSHIWRNPGDNTARALVISSSAPSADDSDDME